MKYQFKGYIIHNLYHMKDYGRKAANFVKQINYVFVKVSIKETEVRKIRKY